MKKLFLFAIWSFLSFFVLSFFAAMLDEFLLKTLSEKHNFDYGLLVGLVAMVIAFFIGYYKSFYKAKVELEEFNAFVDSASDFATPLSKSD